MGYRIKSLPLRGRLVEIMAGFQFQHLPNKVFSSFEAKSTKEYFIKWGLKGHMSVQMFSFDNHFQEYKKQQFVKDFFQDKNVQSAFQAPSQQNVFEPIGKINLTRIEVEEVPATITNMEFFDRIFTDGLVRQSGAICKCFDECFDGFLVSDELRKMLVSDESDFAELFSQEECSELIFRIFKHICLGGPICQYEDVVGPYIDTTKYLYKDLVSVQKDSLTKKLRVNSVALKVSVWAGEALLFPGNAISQQSFAYFIINLSKRNLTVWSYSWQ